jgi:hypothetical protein
MSVHLYCVRRLVAVSLLLAPVIPALLGGGAAYAGSVDVCAHGCRFQDIGSAISAANDGDSITIGRGVYAGGFIIDKSIRLTGNGASRTVIRGGGPTITIGVFDAATEPVVTIRAVTITGGVTRSSPISVPFTGAEGIWATGGGVEIPPSANFGPGATTTIVDSVITGNRVAPENVFPFGPPCQSGCVFAGAAGGGIDNWGNLTLRNTIVSHNSVGTSSGLSDISSDAQGGAIQHWNGDLTLIDSTFDDNTVSATAPNGRFADGGAILVERGTLTMRGDVVRSNHATLNAALPDGVDMLAIAGGVHVGGGVTSAIVRDSEIDDNEVTMTNTVGYTTAFSGGLHTDIINIAIRSDDISDNKVTSATLGASLSDAQGDSGAGELGGTITDTTLNGNTVTVQSIAGNISAGAGATIFSGTLTRSSISGNQVRTSSPQGIVTVAGGGLLAGDGPVTLKATTVSGNSITALANGGTVQGGGIFDSPVPNGPPGGPLTLTHSVVTRNVLSASDGVSVQGGGIYTTLDTVLNNSVVAGNSPDQCKGC